jgi:MraZ protein
VLRGSYTARIDEKGRLKLPSTFKALVEEAYGNRLFVTSVDGASVLIYPEAVWAAHEKEVVGDQPVHALDPARQRYLTRVNFHGQPTEFDSQGRVVIQSRLRESAAMLGEVSVVGRFNFLEVWNFDRLKARLEKEPFTDDDARALARKSGA